MHCMEKYWRKNHCQVEYFILSKVRVQPINDVNLPDRESNKLGGDKIKLGAVYVCNDTHNGILRIIFLKEELHYHKLIFEGEVEISDDDSECNEK